MKNLGVFYGSTTGTCEGIARAIAGKLGIPEENVIDVSKMTTEKVAVYDVLILGTSTWGDGELQDDWYDGAELLKKLNLSDKMIALFGCGDSESYSDTFCDAMGVLYNDLKNTGCTFIGQVSVDDYTFSSSNAVMGSNFVGLALDEVNEDNKTTKRIESWVEVIKGCL
jgi:flavodoxin, long chain